MKASLCALGLLLAGVSAALAGNWPAWRGPLANGQAAEQDVPLHWSTIEHVRWKTALPDEGNSTPIVWGNRVFLTQASDKVDWPPKNNAGPASAHRRAVLCFDRSTGQRLWDRDTIYKEKESTHPTNPFCSASPVTDGERVIASLGSAGLICYDFDGKELWRNDLGKLEHIWGNASSPILYRDLAIIWCGPGDRQFLRAVNKRTGLQVWETAVPGGNYGTQSNDWRGSWSTPLIVRVADHDEMVVAVPEKVKGFDPQTGRELWSCDGAGKLSYASPVYADGIVVVISGYGGPALAVRPGGHGDVTSTHRVWHDARKPPQRIGSPVILEGRVYLLNENGVLQCLDLKTGKDLWDPKPRLEGANSWSSLVAAGGRLYVPNQKGDTFVLAAGPKFERLAKNSLDERVLSSIAVADGDLFIRTYKHLWCIGGKK